MTKKKIKKKKFHLMKTISSKQYKKIKTNHLSIEETEEFIDSIESDW